ncbi:YhdP family protein [Nitrosophilus labii]|uniref:YhdP family protein n=1 Tax=Nitrosophilus labii TaxID=2706014 RepID=UPI0016574F43|nr:AsmA-like C-terminal domain-containing protein [Nitrosophilus labii]
MIIKTVSIINKILISFLIASLLILSIFYLFLQEGIVIKSLKLPSIKVEKLYLKLDKKLILKVDTLYIKKEKKVNRSNDIENFLKSFRYIPQFFQKIKIKNLNFLNYHVTFLYNKGIYFIDTDKYKFAAKLHLHNKTLFVKVQDFYYKKYGLFLKGSSVINLINKNISFNGDYLIQDIKGKIKASLENNILKFNIDSQYFNNESLKKITELFTLHKTIKNWIYKKIVANKYRLEYLNGEIDLKSKNLYVPKNFSGIAYAYNSKIKFNEKLPPVKSEKITLTFKNDSLYFQLKNPVYLNKNLKDSFVVIKNLTSKNSYIDIVIKTASPIDNEIIQLVKAYNIELPIYQKKGITNGVLRIIVTFKNGKVDLEGTFVAKNSILSLKDIDLHIKNTTVRLKNNTIYIEPSDIEIKNIIKSTASGKIDLNKKIANIKINNSKIKILANNVEILDINNFEDTLIIDFSKQDSVYISINRFYTDIFIEKNLTKFHIKDLKHISAFSKPLKELNIKEGTLFVTTKDYKNFQIKSHIIKPNEILYFNNCPVTDFNIEGEIKTDESSFIINEGKIKVIYDEIIKIYLNDYDIKLKEKNNKEKISYKLPDFQLHAKSSSIEFMKHLILSDQYIITHKNGLFDFENIYRDSKINIEGTPEKFYIKATKLNDTFVKKFLNIKNIYGGEYNLIAVGNMNYLKGKITIYNSILKDMALLNNIMAFLNTIPSLVTFSDPGYSKKGYKIKEGKIDFKFEKGVFYINNLNFIGKSLNIEGKGLLNLNSKTIDMILTLKTFKKISTLLSKIPLAGYILFGKDNCVSTQLKVKGDINKPRISTKLPEEVIKAPINIIKRTLQSPFKLFE